jgi:hypothetical protein
MDTIDYTNNTIPWLAPLIVKDPESSVCNLLMHVVQQDEKSKTSFDLLGHLISQNSSDIM